MQYEILSNVVDKRFLPGLHSCCLSLDSINEFYSPDDLTKHLVGIDLSPVLLG